MDVPSSFMINDIRKPDEFRKKHLVVMPRKMYLILFLNLLMKINLKNPVNGV